MDETGEIGYQYEFRSPTESVAYTMYALSFEDAKIKLQGAFPDSKWKTCFRLDRYGNIEKEWTNEE